MTDKIIIDGVDVSECIFLVNGMDCSSMDCDCIKCVHNTCYFKQLKRKEQECKKLKQRVQGEIHLGNNYKKDFAEQVTISQNYEQALDEIEDYCKECNLKADFTACDILQIIEGGRTEYAQEEIEQITLKRIIDKLQAKEQECEELKEHLNQAKYLTEGALRLYSERQNIKYKQALDEIEEIAKHNNFLVRDPFCGTGYRDLSGQILSIINKAKEK